MSKEIFELPDSFSLPSVAKPLTPKDTSALGVSGLGSVATPINEEPIEQKKVQLEVIDKEEVKPDEIKEVKQKRVRKQIDDETRKLMIDRLQKSRKIKELTAETNELKEKLSKLETKEPEPVPIIKYDEPKKRVVKPKIKTIDEPIKKQDEIVLKPLIEQKQLLLEVPKIEQPKKIVHSTFRQPIW